MNWFFRRPTNVCESRRGERRVLSLSSGFILGLTHTPYPEKEVEEVGVWSETLSVVPKSSLFANETVAF